MFLELKMSSKFDTHQIFQAYQNLGFIIDEHSKGTMINFLELSDPSKIYEHRMEIGSNTKDTCVTHNLVKYILDGVISQVCPKNITRTTSDFNKLMEFSIRFDHRGNEIEISTGCDSFHFDKNIFYRIVLQIIDILERDKPDGNLKICYSALIVDNAREYYFNCQRNNESLYVATAKGFNASELLEHIAFKLKPYEYPVPNIYDTEYQKILRAYQALGFIFNTTGPYQTQTCWYYDFCYLSGGKIFTKSFNEVSSDKLFEEILRYIQTITSQSIRVIIPYIVDKKIFATKAITPKDSSKIYIVEFEYSLSFYRYKGYEVSIISSFVPNFQNIEMYYRTILEFLEFQETNKLDSSTEKLMIKFDRTDIKYGEQYKLECRYGDKFFIFESFSFRNGLVQLFSAIRSREANVDMNTSSDVSLSSDKISLSNLPSSDTYTFQLKATPIPRFFIRESEDDMVGLFQITNFDNSTMYGETRRGGAVELRTHTKDVIVNMIPVHSFPVDESDSNKWDISSFMLGKVFNPEHKYIILVNDKEKYEDSYLQGHRLFRLLSQNI